ncbi:MAG TPA: PIN domain-containing protein [Terriglobia bacterium]|nr:PIN domain-containing protein [Terriglobia bacterium]
MAPKTESYVDTSALIAFLDRSDSYHPFFRRLFATPPNLVTSALVIAEGHGWFLRRYDQNRAIQFLSFVGDLPLLQIQAFDDEALTEAGRLIKRFHHQPLTLADAHGLAIMVRRRLSICWSTDRHLGMTGARLVIEQTH